MCYSSLHICELNILLNRISYYYLTPMAVYELNFIKDENKLECVKVFGN